MFITFSKTLARFGGFRIGIGKRITKKNWWYLGVALLFYGMFMLGFYAIIGTLWLMYAMFYGMWWCCKKIFQGIAHLVGKGSNKPVVTTSTVYPDANSFNEGHDAISVERIPDQKKFCPYCGAKIQEGNSFCGKCGKPI